MMTSARKPIHLINAFWNSSGGSEWRTIYLYEMLKGVADVHLWTPDLSADPYFLHKYQVKTIRTGLLQFPKFGTFIIVGPHFHLGRWHHFTLPNRIILIHNIYDKNNKNLLPNRLNVFSQRNRKRIELVFASKFMMNDAGYKDGIIHPSPIDINRFHPKTNKQGTEKFVIGRHSRDIPDKHHSQDPPLYQMLDKEGCCVRIMGGTCLSESLAKVSGVELIPSSSQSADDFLRSLDCFFYRTSEDWIEPFGRVVVEAMSCGLPVVCDSRGGFTELIDSGKNGFIVNSTEEAFNVIMDLKRSFELRQRIGRAARNTIEKLYGSDHVNEMVSYYIS